ncbi:hypothetical protein PoB_005231900 [Plakobranchus ocellatus]|uniref:Notch ligand N-terminal domain-containing protein n=1 Tax=Plakobranchus ocellatus TaxID=259542 RepID=A0AAV4C544_9GAST|nr:hypothetical protein PoB_005231900 [Plakobranchus ocellatus]
MLIAALALQANTSLRYSNAKANFPVISCMSGTSLIGEVPESRASGVLNIRITGFSNPRGHTYDGTCCDGTERDSRGVCEDQCDYVMRLIVSGLGRANDHVFLFHRPLKYDSNDIAFEAGDSNMVLSVLFDRWPMDGQVKMNAFFYDYDDFDHTTTLVDWFETDLRHDSTVTRSGEISNGDDFFRPETVLGNREKDKTLLTFEWAAMCHKAAECSLFYPPRKRGEHRDSTHSSPRPTQQSVTDFLSASVNPYSELGSTLPYITTLHSSEKDIMKYESSRAQGSFPLSTRYGTWKNNHKNYAMDSEKPELFKETTRKGSKDKAQDTWPATNTILSTLQNSRFENAWRTFDHHLDKTKYLENKQSLSNQRKDDKPLELLEEISRANGEVYIEGDTFSKRPDTFSYPSTILRRMTDTEHADTSKFTSRGYLKDHTEASLPLKTYFEGVSISPIQERPIKVQDYTENHSSERNYSLQSVQNERSYYGDYLQDSDYLFYLESLLTEEAHLSSPSLELQQTSQHKEKHHTSSLDNHENGKEDLATQKAVTTQKAISYISHKPSMQVDTTAQITEQAKSDGSIGSKAIVSSKNNTESHAVLLQSNEKVNSSKSAISQDHIESERDGSLTPSWTRIESLTSTPSTIQIFSNFIPQPRHARPEGIFFKPRKNTEMINTSMTYLKIPYRNVNDTSQVPLSSYISTTNGKLSFTSNFFKNVTNSGTRAFYQSVSPIVFNKQKMNQKKHFKIRAYKIDVTIPTSTSATAKARNIHSWSGQPNTVTSQPKRHAKGNLPNCTTTSFPGGNIHTSQNRIENNMENISKSEKEATDDLFFKSTTHAKTRHVRSKLQEIFNTTPGRIVTFTKQPIFYSRRGLPMKEQLFPSNLNNVTRGPNIFPASMKPKIQSKDTNNLVLTGNSGMKRSGPPFSRIVLQQITDGFSFLSTGIPFSLMSTPLHQDNTTFMISNQTIYEPFFDIKKSTEKAKNRTDNVKASLFHQFDMKKKGAPIDHLDTRGENSSNSNLTRKDFKTLSTDNVENDIQSPIRGLNMLGTTRRTSNEGSISQRPIDVESHITFHMKKSEKNDTQNINVVQNKMANLNIGTTSAPGIGRATFGDNKILHQFLISASPSTFSKYNTGVMQEDLDEATKYGHENIKSDSTIYENKVGREGGKLSAGNLKSFKGEGLMDPTHGDKIGQNLSQISSSGELRPLSQAISKDPLNKDQLKAFAILSLTNKSQNDSNLVDSSSNPYSVSVSKKFQATTNKISGEFGSDTHPSSAKKHDFLENESVLLTQDRTMSQNRFQNKIIVSSTAKMKLPNKNLPNFTSSRFIKTDDTVALSSDRMSDSSKIILSPPPEVHEKITTTNGQAHTTGLNAKTLTDSIKASNELPSQTNIFDLSAAFTKVSNGLSLLLKHTSSLSGKFPNITRISSVDDLPIHKDSYSTEVAQTIHGNVTTTANVNSSTLIFTKPSKQSLHDNITLHNVTTTLPDNSSNLPRSITMYIQNQNIPFTQHTYPFQLNPFTDDKNIELSSINVPVDTLPSDLSHNFTDFVGTITKMSLAKSRVVEQLKPIKELSNTPAHSTLKRKENGLKESNLSSTILPWKRVNQQFQTLDYSLFETDEGVNDLTKNSLAQFSSTKLQGNPRDNTLRISPPSITTYKGVLIAPIGSSSHLTPATVGLPEDGFILHTHGSTYNKHTSNTLSIPNVQQGIRIPIKDEAGISHVKHKTGQMPALHIPHTALYEPDITDSDSTSETAVFLNTDNSSVAMPGPVQRFGPPRPTLSDVGLVLSRHWPAVLGVTIGTIFLITALVTSVVCRQRRLLVQRSRWVDSPQHLNQPPAAASEYGTCSAASLSSDLTRSSTNLV